MGPGQRMAGLVESSPNTQVAPKWACWLLHLFTASGAFIGLLAIQAADRGQALLAFQLMMMTIVIDAADGTIARRLKVSEALPHIDGRTLDDIVDYFTYVLVPIYTLVKLNLIASSPFIWAVPVMASALGFSNVDAKTEDDYFLGFPSYWNLVALYLFCLGWPVWVNTVFVLLLAVMVFAPLRFIYPSKTVPYRIPTLVLGTIWGAQTVALVVCPDILPDWWLMGALFYPVYYVSMSLHLHRVSTR